MPQIQWPTRRIQCSTLTGSAEKFFSVGRDNRDSLVIGEQVTFVNGNSRSTRYIFVPPDAPPAETYDYVLATDSHGRNIEDSVPGSFVIESQVGLIVNYPTRPMLVDPGAQTRTTVNNPLDVRTWTSGRPRYEGSVVFEVSHAADVPIVEAFIDQLSDPDAWFELPLPGNHLGLNNVTAYTASTGEITIDVSSSGNAELQDRYLHGWFGRVGARTVKVTSSRQDGTDMIITIAPPGLITGTTATRQANSFSSVTTCRVRANQIVSAGSADFGAIWTLDWVETDRKD